MFQRHKLCQNLPRNISVAPQKLSLFADDISLGVLPFLFFLFTLYFSLSAVAISEVKTALWAKSKTLHIH